jgi:hypothetical protein
MQHMLAPSIIGHKPAARHHTEGALEGGITMHRRVLGAEQAGSCIIETCTPSPLASMLAAAATAQSVQPGLPECDRTPNFIEHA